MRNWKRLLGVAALASASLSANAMVTAKAKANKSVGAEAVEGEFVVKFKSANVAMSTMKAELASVGLKVAETVNAEHSTYLVKVSDKRKAQSVLQAASELSNVEYIEPNFVYRIATTTDLPQNTPNDSDFGRLWGMNNSGGNDSSGRAGKVDADIDAPEAWNVTTGSKDVIVAVVDTGVDYTHPDLKDNIWEGPNGIHGYNAITDALDPMDDHSHGTHCSGTIGGTGNNGQGVAGVSWNVKIMGVKFLSGAGSGTLDDAIKAIDWATEHGAQVMSNSWGGGGFSQALEDSIKRAAAKGIVFIAAAGNESNNNDSRPSYPASYAVDNVIAVAASNNQDTIASFSNYGRTSTHLMAPGENIYSTVLDGGYATYSGTSMATPHVSGATALLLGKEPSLTPAQVRERLMATSDKFKAYRNKLASAGRLNAYNLVTNTIPPGFVTIPDSAWKIPVAQAIKTTNPYADGAKLRWEIKKEGATYIRLHFSRFQTEAGYDKLTIKDAAGNVVDELSGTLGNNFWSSEVEGDTMVIEFETDSSINDWGFQIDQLGWTDFQAE